jgi:hypothetical protein
MKHTILKTLQRSLIALSLAYSGAGLASTALPPGSGPVPLIGTPASVEADLAGGVVYDKVIPFVIRTPTGAVLFAGSLQNRVVKSNRAGHLHFYYRIRDTKPGLNGIVAKVETYSFASTPRIEVDWRPDGLGFVNPATAQRTVAPGAIVTFNFVRAGSMVMVGGNESKFFYVKSPALNYKLDGRTMIVLTTGQRAVIPSTANPIP